MPVALIELLSQVILHKFNSPAWLKHIQKANAALGALTPEKMSNLRPRRALHLVKQGERRGLHEERSEDPLPPARDPARWRDEDGGGVVSTTLAPQRWSSMALMLASDLVDRDIRFHGSIRGGSRGQ